MKPWKFAALFPLAVDVPGVGPVDTAALDVELWWDIQLNHATFVGRAQRTVVLMDCPLERGPHRCPRRKIGSSRLPAGGEGIRTGGSTTNLWSRKRPTFGG